MTKTLIKVAIYLAICSISVLAQNVPSMKDTQGNFEGYLGYQLVRVNPDVKHPDFRFDKSKDAHGANLSGTYYFSDVATCDCYNLTAGLTGELGFNFGGGFEERSLVTAMGGLTIKARNPHVQPYIRGLVGVGRLHSTNELSNNIKVLFGRTDTGIAFATGIGLDAKFKSNGRLGWRILGVDYLQTRNFDTVQHNIRLTSGLIW